MRVRVARQAAAWVEKNEAVEPTDAMRCIELRISCDIMKDDLNLLEAESDSKREFKGKLASRRKWNSSHLRNHCFKEIACN